MSAIIEQTLFEQEAYPTQMGFLFDSATKKLVIPDDDRYVAKCSFTYFILYTDNIDRQTAYDIQKGGNIISDSSAFLNTKNPNNWTFKSVNLTEQAVYYDGGRRAAFSAGTPYDFSNASDFEIGEGTFAQIANFAIWSRDLTKKEMDILRDSGGFIPESLRSSLLSYYPMQQYPFKDAGNVYGRGLDALVMFDAVGQFGFFAPNHGRLEGFSDVEVGLPKKRDSSLKDFYTNQLIEDGLLKVGNAEKHIVMPFSRLSEIDYFSPFCLKMQFIYNGNNHLSSVWGEGILGKSTLDNEFMIVNNFQKLPGLVFMFLKNGSVATGIRSLEFLEIGKEYEVLVAYNGGSPIVGSQLLFYINGKKQTVATFSASVTGLSNNSDFVISRKARFDGVSPKILLKTLEVFSFFPDTNDVKNIFDKKISGRKIRFNETDGSLVNDTLINYSSDDLISGAGFWLEKKSLLPKISQSLLIQTTQSIAKAVTACKGMGFSMKSGTITALSDIISNLPSIDKFYLNGIPYVNESALITALNLVDFAQVDLAFSADFTGTLSFVHTGVDYYLARHYYLSASIEIYEHKKLFDNGFLKNPSIEQQANYLHYYQGMEGSFINNVENRDLIGAENATVTGFADLAAARLACVDLDLLR